MSRGNIGILPRTPKLADESYLDFVKDVRINFRHGMFPPLSEIIDTLVDERMNDQESKPDLDDIRAVSSQLFSAKAWQRFMRTHQEMAWRRARDCFEPVRDQLETEIKEAENQSPGKVTLNPNLILPEYLRYQIHLQPGGYISDALAGRHYLYGTKVFYLGLNDQDELHQEIVDTTKAPEDGKVRRVLDVGCSLGQASIKLKERFPDASVIGIDASAAMVRYAHWNAIQRNIDIEFIQALAENTGFEEASFDIVLVYILFHELPLEVTKKVTKEIFRLLRPGGEWSVFDFPTNGESLSPAHHFLVDYDNRNNCEPWSPQFVYSDFRGILDEAGFEVTTGPSNTNGFLQTLTCRKPG
ncbi:class I SAM-dependent methyltransferase [Sphingorhabdus sp. EL138]|uniref:class I SAM-dependent methyltransferase n=1 Tax=Sphingorhabdus sp. EL138 TaxID=2073156 RepID=UPI000D692DEE|nr:class I SAM-dependent methyltransferase [Sphingorhabdus sp. EL138]